MASTDRKVAVITGAASGIGKACVERLLSQGVEVLALDRDEGALAGLRAASSGKPLHTVVVDIGSEDSVRSSIEQICKVTSRIDYLINSAGIDHLDRIAECSFADWRRILSVNLDGTFLMCQAVVRKMIAQRSGRIVNVASWLAKAGMAGHGPYAASKFGIVGLTQSLAKEVADLGITVNSVCPGPVEHTQMRAEADAQSLVRGLSTAKDRLHLIPMGRMAVPDDVAGVILFLLSDDAAYMTGQAINVTGGLWMN
jgi:NAD(P)-dependent dehydrogenase (short-subunit alcohol dehydrogenase family)